MKPIIILFIALGGFLCTMASGTDADSSLRPEQLAGKWYRGDGTGYNVTITFSPDLSYSAVWEGCLGTYGTARGKWRIEDQKVVFIPAEEKDMMRDHLRRLDVEHTESGVVLVPPDIHKEFEKYGTSSRYWCFQRAKDK